MGGLSFVTKTLSHKLKASRFVPLPYPVLDTGIFPTALSVSSSYHLAILASRNVDSLLVRWGVEQAGERQGTGGVKEITGASGEAGDRQIGGGTEVVVDEVERVGREGGAGQAELRGSEPGNGVVREKYEKMNGFLEVGKEGEEEKLLYGEVVEVDAREEGEEEVEEGGKVNVKVLDALVGLGPLVSGDAGAGGGQVVCCGGRGGKGELIRGERGIGAELLGRCKVSDLRVGGAGFGDSKGVSGLWVLPSAGAEEVDEEMNSLGGFVLASVDSRTECYRYLGSTVEREMAVDTLGFEVAFQTWAVGGIGGGRGLVQVYGTHGEGAVRLIWEGVPTQELPLWDDREVGGCGLPPGAEIAGAEVCDPYVLIVTRQGQKAGQVTLLRLEEEEGELVPVDLSGTLPQASLGHEKGEGMTAACLFHWGQGHGIDGSAHGWVLAGGDEEGEGDEEEGFLYAEESSAPRVTVTAREDGNDTQEGQAPMDVDDPTTVQQQAEAEKGDLGLGESIYLALALFSGSLDIYHLPTLRHVFHGSQLNFGPQLLRNFLLYPDLKASRVEPSPLHVTALRICTIGSSQPELQCLVLCAYTSDHTFLLYTPRPLPTPSLHPLPFSFLRLSHDHLTQIPRRLPDPPPPLSNPIFAFTDLNTVAGQRGLFLAGHNPAWILCERGVVIIRQARLREAQAKTGLPPHAYMTAFAAFPDAENGFMVAHSNNRGESVLSLCSLDVQPTLGNIVTAGNPAGASMTSRRYGALGCEAKLIAYLDVPTSTPSYAVVVGPAIGLTAEEEAEEEEAEQAEHVEAGGVEDEHEDAEGGKEGGGGERKKLTGEQAILQSLPRLTNFCEASRRFGGPPRVNAGWAGGHQVWVMGGVRLGKQGGVGLRGYERGLALLCYKSWVPDRARSQGFYGRYLVVGTGMVRAKGEDVPAKGRMVVYRVGVRDDRATLTHVDEAQQRSGPPEALAQLHERIVMAAGPTLWVYQFVNERLRPIAFYDADFYAVSLRAVKSFLAVTDAYHSVHLLRWHEYEPTHQLELLGKGYEPIVTAQPAAHFVVDPPSLGVIVQDNRGNVQMLQYDQADVESRGGDKLLRRADFHLGHRMSFSQHVRPAPVPRPGAVSQGCRILLFGTLEGGAGAFIPLDEKVFRRLYALQAVMVNALAHPCALNPRGYRLVEARSFLPERKKTILDGELLWRYTGLDVETQEDLASAIGSSRDLILDTLLEIDMMTWI